MSCPGVQRRCGFNTTQADLRAICCRQLQPFLRFYSCVVATSAKPTRLQFFLFASRPTEDANLPMVEGSASTQHLPATPPKTPAARMIKLVMRRLPSGDSWGLRNTVNAVRNLIVVLCAEADICSRHDNDRRERRHQHWRVTVFAVPHSSGLVGQWKRLTDAVKPQFC